MTFRVWGAMAITFNPVLAVLLFVFMDGAGNVRDPIFADYLNRHVKSENRATVLSIISLLVSVYTFFMQPLLGFLADKNLSYSFTIASVIILVGSLTFRLDKNHITT